MDWQEELIMMFLNVCQPYEYDLWVYSQRMSPNSQPEFSDEEVMTIYLWGIYRGHRSVKKIYEYTLDHLRDWFPLLPSYQTYSDRLNRLGFVFVMMAMRFISFYKMDFSMPVKHIIDSLPIIISRGSRYTKAKVASEIADCGYCASKDLPYYGTKLHMIAIERSHTIPIPDTWTMTPASPNDITVVQQHVEELRHLHLIGDKAYPDEGLQQEFKEHGGLLETPIKRKRNDPPLTLLQRAYNTLISKIRQPIETLIEWIDEKTGIQNASKVRSTKGLLVHVFGRLTVAIWIFVNFVKP